jgi:hypothetical protein
MTLRNYCTYAAMAVFLLYLFPSGIFAQCLNSTPFGGGTAPTSGNTLTMSTCNYATEYASVTGVVAATNYQVTSSIGTDFITVRQGTSNGPVIASGTQPLNWTSTVAGNYFIHFNTNSSCGTNTNCRTTSLIATCTAPGDQISYGTNQWIGYVYQHTNNGNPSPAFQTAQYKGFETRPEIFDANWGTGAISGVNICGSYNDRFHIRYKMTKNFPAGNYIFHVGGDDGYRLSIDGGATWLINNYSDHGYQVSTVTAALSGNVNLVLEYYENGGDARVTFDYSMYVPSTGNNSYTTCSGVLTDNGGPLGNYANNWNGFTVLYPGISGNLVRVSGTTTGENCCDFLRIYNGIGIGGALLWSGVANAGTVPQITSTSGPLTIQFTSDISVTGAGFQLNIACVPPPYQSTWVSMNTGSANWCPGETRTVSVTVTNSGSATWTNAAPDINIGVKWNAEADYFVRVNANGLAPGATQTYNLTVTAPATPGTNNLTFDVVNEGNCWFGNNNGSCGPGNAVYTSPLITITPQNTVAAGQNRTVCQGSAMTTISLATTGATGATVTGLPAGVTGSWAGNVVTISGTPTASGTFNYTVTTTGGCPPATTTGTITVQNIIAPQAVANVTVGAVYGGGALLPDGNLTATTCWNGDGSGNCSSGAGHEGWRGRLFNAGTTGALAWAAQNNVIGTDYLQIDLGSIKPINAIATQSRGITRTTGANDCCNDQRVTQYEVRISNDGISYTSLGIFAANTAINQNVVINNLPAGNTGRFVRLYPTAIAGHMSMRADVISIPCFNAGGQTVSLSAEIVPGANTVRWWSAASGGTLLGTGQNFSPTIISNTTFYAEGYNSVSGCVSATRTAVIAMVTPQNTVAAGQNRTVCQGSAIATITLATTGATGATVTGLPAGVTGSWAGNVVTISGTPTASGTFNYTVTTTGGCPPATTTGTITVNSLSTPISHPFKPGYHLP